LWLATTFGINWVILIKTISKVAFFDYKLLQISFIGNYYSIFIVGTSKINKSELPEIL